MNEPTTYDDALDLACSMGGATVDTFVLALDGYLECALWSSCDLYTGRPLDELGAGAVADETFDDMACDVWRFLATCWGDVWEDFEIDLSGIEPEQLGHDLWLTRNRHGAGFWDRGLGEIGDKLTELAHSYGDVTLYIYDDGKIYA